MLSMIRSRLFRLSSLPLLCLGGAALAQAPQNMQAPPTVPTIPVPPPINLLPPPQPLPKLAPAQQAFLKDWLTRGAEQGLTSRTSTAQTRLEGDALVQAALDRARALYRGRVDTADFLEIWALRPAAYDPLPAFAQAVTENRLPQWASGLTPPYAGYDGLRKGLTTYEAIEASGGWPTLTAESAPAAVRARLVMEDRSSKPDEPLSEAIQRAQRRYGLNPTGLLDARTLDALNVPVEDRIGAIMANMERWRWLPRELPVDRVQVNIAAAVLTLFEGDTPVASMKAVTGKPGNETPMLASSIHSIVVNPPWNVPTSIARKELWPKGRKTLIAQGYRIVGTPETGERLVQPPGPGNSLGRLKFDFNNPFAVYLHDTPARARFASYDRLASHGCIRLEKPLPLAERMLEGDPQYAGRVQELIDAGKTQRVPLARQVAVYLLYWTAFASADGRMNFRQDPYGWDKLLASKIEASSARAAAVTMTMKE
jgi:murein L,D-transpeptidase YcbB/YkuD